MVNDFENDGDVHKIILALLISRKESTSLERLKEDYQEQEGKPIPWKKLGYATLLDYLRSMKDVILEKINDIYYVRGVASDKSKHISSLVARQKTPLKYQSSSRKYNYYYPKASISRVHIPSDILSNLISMIKQSPNGINKDYVLKMINSKLPHLNLSIMDLEKQVRDLSHEIYIDGHRIFPVQRMPILNKPSYLNNLPKVENENLRSNDSVKTNSKYVVSGDTEYEESDDDYDIISKKLLENNSEDNMNQISNKKQSISTFIQETVSKFNMHNYNSTNNDTLDIYLEKLDKEDITVANKENIKFLISDVKRDQLKKLIEKYPNGIWCSELPEKYRNEYNVTLNYIDLGFNSVREFASYLPEIFQCKKHSQSVDYILYDTKRKLTNINENIKTSLSNNVEQSIQPYLEENEAGALPIAVSSHTSNKLIPEDIMALGESVGQVYVTDLQNRSQQYIEVFVEEVFTPSFFWIQLREQKRRLNKLMDDIHHFYEEKSLNYKIPAVVLKKGLNCACKYDNFWHRGIIQSVRNDLHVTVMFYDYGTLKTYPPEKIFYLHQAFSYLPAQAIPCGLYNIKPAVGERWSRGVTYQFADKVCERPLIATIISVNSENNSMSVTLTDTIEENDVHINDWMTHQNLAVYGKMVSIRLQNFPFYYYLKSKKTNKTNVEDIDSSVSDISRTNETSAIYLLNNMYKILYRKLSASLINHCKSAQHLQELSNNIIKSSPFETSKRLDDHLLEISKNNKQCSSDVEVLSNPSEKSEFVSNITRSTVRNQDSTKMMYFEKDEFKTEPEETIGLHCISSATQSKKEENCDINEYIQQKKRQHKEIPLLNRCFANAVNFSLNLQSKYQDYDTSPDDNILTTGNNFKLISKCNNYIDLQNIKIAVPEIILSVLRTDKNHVNDQFSPNTIQNTNDSLNKIEQLTISKSNISSKLVDEENSSSIIEINQESNHECETSETLMQIHNKCNEDTKLDSDDYFNLENYDISNNTNNNNNEREKKVLDIRTNEEKSNSILRKSVNKNNLIKTIARLQSLLKTKECYPEYTELHKSTKEVISNDNNLQRDNNEWNIENNVGNAIFSKLKINPIVENQRHENLDNVINNDTNIKNNKISSDSKGNPFLEAMNRQINSTYEEIIQPDNDLQYSNDDDDKWSIVGNLDDFTLGKAILSSLSINPIINNDGEQIQIAEINNDL